MSLPNNVSGFTVLPITYTHSTHIIYARSHVSRSTDKAYPAGRTLFLVNVPPDATERELILLFKDCGTVERVIFPRDTLNEQNDMDEGDSDEDDAVEESMKDNAKHPAEERQPRKKRKLSKEEREKAKPPTVVPLPTNPLRTFRKTGGCAHIVFLDAASLDRALATPAKPRPWPQSEEPFGLTHYTALYSSLRPPLDIIKEHADSAMELYEYQVAKAKQKSTYRRGEAIVDEDGFTIVTRGGAYGQSLGGGVSVASKDFQETGETQSRKKKDPKEKETFYAFQKAEKQRNAIMELRKNWEADKARVEKLKESRQFKPY